MKIMIKLLLAAMIMVLSMPTMNAQTYEWQKPPKEGEKEVEMIIDTVCAGWINTYPSSPTEDKRRTYSVEQQYKQMYDKVKRRLGDTYPQFSLRQFKSRTEEKRDWKFSYMNGVSYDKYYFTSAILVVPDAPKPTEQPLSKAIDKALMEVREGSRIAIDQIRVPTGTDRAEYEDEVVELLIDKGFKVVAKGYMEKLYEEQQSQQSGIYNERTTVQENNFSAVGYYMNVKLTETTLRVQVINVSTGEYDGNVTIQLQ